MRKLFILLLCVTFTSLTAGEQITIFGNAQKTNFARLSLSPNSFTNAMLAAPLSGDPLLRICESIDNSEIVIFGVSLPANCLDNLFSQESIRNSLRELLRRGGVLYFSPLYYDNISHFPGSMKTFFRANSIPLIHHGHYREIKNAAGQEAVMRGSAAPDYTGTLLKPGADGKTPEFLAIRHLNKLDDIGLKPLIVGTPGGFPIAAYADGLLGRGMIIYNYCYNVARVESHPFFDNLVTQCHGPRRILSNKEIVRAQLAKANAATATTAAAPGTAAVSTAAVLELNHPAEVTLRDARSQELGRARLELQNSVLTVEFQIPAAAQRTAATQRDEEVWVDDFVEVAIAVNDTKSADVFQFLVNSRGVLYDSKNGAAGWNGAAVAVTQPEPAAATGWAVRIAIPLTALGIDLARQPWFKLNLGYGSGKKIASWQPTQNFAARASMGFAATVPATTLAARLKPAAPPKSGKGGIKLWTPNPLSKVYTDMFPASGTPEVTHLKAVTARNERENLVLAVSNPTDDNLYFRLETQLRLANGRNFRELVPEILESIPWRTTVGDVINEPLLPSNGVLVLPALETRLLVIPIQSDLPAGTYQWQLAFVPVNAEVPGKKVDFTVELLNYRFPNDLGLYIYTFGPYITKLAEGQKRQYFQRLRDWHINVVQNAEGPRSAIRADGSISDDPADYRNGEALFNELGLRWVYGYGVYAHFKREMEKRKLSADLNHPAVKAKFQKWLTNWAKTLHGDGIDFSRFEVPILDEPRNNGVPEFLLAARTMKEAVPEFRLINTIATWTTPDEARQLLEVLDVAIPYEPRITSRATAAAELAMYRQSGKPFYSYLCAFDGNSGAYLDYFRHRGLRSYLSGSAGFALWCVNSWRGNPWDNTEDVKKGGAWLVMNGSDGPTTTMRLEMFREGAEDLFLLREAARSQDPELQRLSSKATVQSLLDANRTDRETALLQWREEILRALARCNPGGRP